MGRHIFRFGLVLSLIITLYLVSLNAAEDSHTLFHKAEKLFQEEKYSEALRLYERVIALDSTFVQAYLGIVRCYTDSGDAQGAVIYMEFLLLEHPDSAEVLYGLGCALYSLKKYNDAIIYFEKAIQRKPDLAEAWNNSAAIYHFIIRDYKRARTYYEKAIAISKKFQNVRVLEIAEKNLSHLPGTEVKIEPVTESLTLEEFIDRFITGVERGDEMRMRQLVMGQKQNSEKAMDWFLNKALGSHAERKIEDENATVLMAKLLEKEYRTSFKDSSLQEKVIFYERLNDEQKKTIYKGDNLLKEGLQKEEKGLYAEAQKKYQEARSYFERVQDKKRVSVAFAYEGDVYRKIKNYPLARTAYSNALTYSTQTNDHEQQALVLSALGITCYFLGEHTEALNYLKRSSEVYHTLKDEEAVKKVNQNIELIEAKIKPTRDSRENRQPE